MSIRLKIDPKDAFREMRECACFGTTLKEFKENSFLTDFEDPASLLMLSMSLQSNCQELIERLPGDETTGRETLRQWLNLSKYLVSEAMFFIKREKQ